MVLNHVGKKVEKSASPQFEKLPFVVLQVITEFAFEQENAFDGNVECEQPAVLCLNFVFLAEKLPFIPLEVQLLLLQITVTPPVPQLPAPVQLHLVVEALVHEPDCARLNVAVPLVLSNLIVSISVVFGLNMIDEQVMLVFVALIRV